MADNNYNSLTETDEAFLISYLHKLQINNACFTVEPIAVPGDNFLSNIKKIRVKTQNCDLQWVLKSAIQQEQFRKSIPMNKIYKREMYVYTKVFAEFTRFQELKMIPKPFQSYAKILDSYLVEPNECILMEDMQQIGYSTVSRLDPLDLHHVSLVMTEYGRFHALSFALRDQEPELFRELSQNTQEIYFDDSTFVKEDNLIFIQEETQRVLDTLDSVTHKSAYKKFKHFRKRLLTSTRQVVQPQRSEEYSVICHGDSWIKNFLYKYSNLSSPTRPTDLCILDWQMCRFGSPALDLSYFIFASTDGDFRSKHFDEILKIYYDSFSTFLTELGSDPLKLFPFSVLEQHLKIYSVFGLFMVTQILHLVLSDQEEIPDMHNATDDQEALDQFNYESQNIEKYKSRVRSVVIDFDKRGYIF